MKKFLIIALVALTSFSCMKNNYSRYSWSRTMLGTMTTTNLSTGSSYVNETQYIKLEMEDAFVSMVNFYLLDVKFVEMMPAQPEIKMPNVPFTLSTDEEMPANSWIISTSSLVPTIGGVPYEQYTMTDIHGVITDNYINLSFRVEMGGATYQVSYLSNSANSGKEEDEE